MKMVDAKEPLTITIQACHIVGGKRKDQKDCMLAKYFKQDLQVEEVHVHRNTVWVRFKGNKLMTRYQSTPTARTAIASFDKTLQKAVKAGLIKLPEGGIEITLRPPRKATSLEHLRSDKMKAIRAASAKRRAAKAESRPHNVPDALTLEGVRISQGYRAD
jgi:hypothetical protein